MMKESYALGCHASKVIYSQSNDVLAILREKCKYVEIFDHKVICLYSNLFSCTLFSISYLLQT